jgi:hypothetical protein
MTVLKSKDGQKVTHWSGRNKINTRNKKVSLIGSSIKEGFLREEPYLLSFAGGPAIFERLLTDKGLVTSDNIVTVQDCMRKSNGYPSEKILRTLIGNRDEHLPDMSIWPYNFTSFVAGYKGDTVRIPPVNPGTPPKWYGDEDFRKEMEKFIDEPAYPFDILDIDMCGPWSPQTGTDIAGLMKNGKLDLKGLMFINHLKGRDVRKGKTLAFLKQYFKRRKFIQLNKITDYSGTPLNLDGTDEFTLLCFRTILVPLFYITEAYFSGYHLRVNRLIEYRDRNKETGQSGTNMMQWLFTFEATDVKLSGLTPRDEEYDELAFADNLLYLENIQDVMRGTFPYEENIEG